MFIIDFRLLLVSLCSMFIITGAIGQQTEPWQMQPSTIQTRWAKDVNPNYALPEYPRPQMVREGNWRNLNGLWDYAITREDSVLPSAYMGKILVPYPLESALSGVRKALQPNELLWYHRTVKIDAKGKQRILLHFGAVDWQATIFVNGTEIGKHTGGYTAFTFDITSVLKAGDNEIIVKVYDPTDEGIGPHGKQVLNPGNIYYTSSSGIWQTVWLETVPIHYIRDIRLTPDIDQQVLNAKVYADEGYDIELEASTSGKLVSVIKGKTGTNLTIPVKNPKLWSPESPFLYDLKIRLLKNGKCIDVVNSYFGMRKVAIQKDSKGFDRIYLNNKYYYNLGTLDQGFWPDGLYTAPTDSALQFDIKAIKAMGFNTVRKHIKVEPARWYYHVDKLGLLVWQDMVNPNQGLPGGSKPAFESECAEILTQLHNFPSITTWVLFNEKWGQYDQERLTKWMKQIDPSRLVNGHSGEYLYVNNELRSPSPNAYIGSDMTDVHSYPNPKMPLRIPGKALVCGEFGGIGVPIEGHLWDDLMAGWGYDGIASPVKMLEQYGKMIDSLCKLEKEGLTASIYTQPFDVESEQNGIVTYDREILKIPIVKLIDAHAKLLHKDPTEMAYLGNIRISPPDAVISYQERLKTYLNGRIDSAFLRGFAIAGRSTGDTINSVEAGTKFISQLRSPFKAENIRFIGAFTTRSTEPGFGVLLASPESANVYLGKDGAEALLTYIIEKEYVIPFINENHKPNWDSIRENVKKFGIIGQETLLQAQVFYSINHKDEALLAECLPSWFKLYGSKRKWISAQLLNNMAWEAFTFVTDKDILSQVAKISEHALSMQNAANIMDTHANLLYKLGNTITAISLQEKAVSAAPENKAILANYNKMKKGVPTW